MIKQLLSGSQPLASSYSARSPPRTSIHSTLVSTVVLPTQTRLPRRLIIAWRIHRFQGFTIYTPPLSASPTQAFSDPDPWTMTSRPSCNPNGRLCHTDLHSQFPRTEDPFCRRTMETSRPIRIAKSTYATAWPLMATTCTSPHSSIHIWWAVTVLAVLQSFTKSAVWTQDFAMSSWVPLSTRFPWQSPGLPLSIWQFSELCKIDW